MFVILLVILAILIWIKNISNRHKKLKSFVSPPGRRIFKHLHLFTNSETLLQNLMDTIKDYGGLLRLELIYGKDILVITDKKCLNFVLGSTTIINKSEIYRHTRNWLGTGLLTSDRKKWEKHRKIITPAFRVQILENYVEAFHKPSDILIRKLKQEMPNDGIDIFPFITLCTLDVICETAMGTKIHAQENKYSDYVTSIKEECKILIARNQSIYKSFDLLYIFSKEFWRERKALNILHSFTRDILNKRKLEKLNNVTAPDDTETKKNRSFLDLLLETKLDEKPMSDKNIAQEVDTFMFAGHDTTATGTSFTLYCISQNADVQRKILEEQKLIFGDDERLPTYKDLQEMKYLEMVIKESMRLYPPVPLIGRETESEVEYEDSVIPKGGSIVIFTYGIHRNPFYFEDPDQFIPERFDTQIEPFTYIPFGAGVRNCIGQRFAMLEMKYLISRILKEFELLPLPEFVPKLIPNIVLTSSNGILIKFQERK